MANELDVVLAMLRAQNEVLQNILKITHALGERVGALEAGVSLPPVRTNNPKLTLVNPRGDDE